MDKKHYKTLFHPHLEFGMKLAFIPSSLRELSFIIKNQPFKNNTISQNWTQFHLILINILLSILLTYQQSEHTTQYLF